MPLNVDDNNDSPLQERQEPQPILHTPQEGRPILGRLLGILFGVVVLAAVVFLIYSYNIFGGRDRAQQALEHRGDREQAASPQITEQSQTQREEQTPATSVEPIQKEPTGTGQGIGDARYTIYIAAYKERTDAVEEVGRWSGAGFDSYVSDVEGWHRVALGRYVGYREAKHEAEKLREAFEYGYWIGPM